MSSSRIAECTHRFKKGRWNRQLCEDTWASVGFSSDAHAVRLAYDIQHCLKGLTEEHLDWLDDWQKNQKHICWPLYWRLLSAELHLGMMHEAELRFERLARQRWSIRRAHALQYFPLVLDYLNRQRSYDKDLLTSRNRQLASSLLERATTLPHWCETLFSEKNINKPSTRIAVVGNGPSIIRSSAGKRIDTADLVIRFNQIHIDESVSHDTGQQTGLWVVSPGFRINGKKMPCDTLCLSGPAPLMRSSRYWSRLAQLPFSRLALTPLDSWYSLVELLEAPPSAGILILDTLIRHLPNLLVECHGFTTDTTEAADATLAGTHYGDCHTVSTRHDWRKESMLIQQWISMGKLR